MDIHRAVRSNFAYLPLWRSSLPQILTLLGFTLSCPTEYSFAGAVARWQASSRPPLKADGIVGPVTWQRIRAAINVPPFQPSLPPDDVENWGPQSFADAEPGTIPIDVKLLSRNRIVEETLFNDAKRFEQAGDFRWFFVYAHAQITRQINQNIQSFHRPNALLLLNLNFSEEFIRALNGLSHDGWRKAFQFCKALQDGSKTNPYLAGPVEFCGARMANVHIHMDLDKALSEVGCIPPDDYSQVLVFVNRGALAATVELRGRFLGVSETMASALIAPLVGLDVKVWRNTVYQNRCNAVVPDLKSPGR